MNPAISLTALRVLIPLISCVCPELLACLTDVLERMVSGRTKANELEGLLSWKWKGKRVVNVVDV